MIDDNKIAGIGRSLASALSRFARDRRDEDRKEIARLQSELCAGVRAENEVSSDAEEK
jgi:hypothetical protein